MSLFLRILGAVVGAPLGFALVAGAFAATHPRQGCMDGLAFLPWLPVAGAAFLAGGFVGARSAPGLVVWALNGGLALARQGRRARKRRRRAAGASARRVKDNG